VLSSPSKKKTLPESNTPLKKEKALLEKKKGSAEGTQPLHRQMKDVLKAEGGA
jgi:hypothetical protein